MVTPSDFSVSVGDQRFARWLLVYIGRLRCGCETSSVAIGGSRSSGRVKETYDNEAWVREAMAAQRFLPDESGAFRVPKDRLISMRIPRELIPTLPNGGPVTMNLRVDDSFVEDAGWHAAAERYAQFLQSTEGKHVLFLELGVGGNTPMIIKYPFWAMTAENPSAVYVCLNYDEAVCPEQIKARSLCLDGESGEVLKALQRLIH